MDKYYLLTKMQKAFMLSAFLYHENPAIVAGFYVGFADE